MHAMEYVLEKNLNWKKERHFRSSFIHRVFRKVTLAPSNLGCLFTRFRPSELASPLSITHCQAQGLIHFTEQTCHLL